MATLYFVEEWPAQGREFPVPSEATIGRADAEVLLPDPDVSRRHAIVRSADTGVTIEDLDSRNGTFVNGERIVGVAPLRVGDKIQLGNTIWHVRSRGGDAAETRNAVRAEATSTSQVPAEGAASGDAASAARSDSMPSAIRRVLPAQPLNGELSAFNPPAARFTGESAARRLEATILSYAVVAATAIAVTLYLILR